MSTVYLERRTKRRAAALWAILGGGAALVAAGLLLPAPTPAEPEVGAAAPAVTVAVAPLRTPPAAGTAAGPRAPFVLGPALDPGPAAAHTAAPTAEASAPAATAPAAMAPAPAAPAPAPRRVDVEVAAGDTLIGMLLRLGIARAEAHAAVEGLRGVYDPRRLRPGQRLEIETDAAARRLVRLAFAPNGRARIELVRADGGAFEADLHERATVVEERLVEARVRTSLHAAATRRGIPPGVFAEVVRIFSWDVDYQRETRPGDRLAVLYERERVPDGPPVGAGTVRYARLEIGGRVLEAFRWSRAGESEFFTRDGESLRKFLLRTPVSGARVSSTFGMRRHPILGYTRMHRGVDFAAPTGTPIYAAGAGRLVRVGRHGGYGNYVRIDHGGGYATAYAHLSRFAAGMRAGRRVEQGEVIGYVGSTGRSTGPHLHFEVIEHGAQVDPLDVAQPPAERLEGTALAAFRRAVRTVDTRVAALEARTVAADRGAETATDG